MSLTRVLAGGVALGRRRAARAVFATQKMNYHAEVIDHYENPRNVGTSQRNKRSDPT